MSKQTLILKIYLILKGQIYGNTWYLKQKLIKQNLMKLNQI